MYAFESRARGKLFHLLVCGSFAAALLLFGFSGVEGMSYPVIYQLTALILLTAGTYLLVRYSLRSYRYEISESGIVSADGETLYDLVITEISGNRRRVVTRVALRDIDEVQSLSREKGHQAQKTLPKGWRMLRYTNRPLEPEGVYLTVSEESTVVVIPKDDTMVKYLKMYGTVTKEGV